VFRGVSGKIATMRLRSIFNARKPIPVVGCQGLAMPKIEWFLFGDFAQKQQNNRCLPGQNYLKYFVFLISFFG
jgi:hypothetical protein